MKYIQSMAVLALFLEGADAARVHNSDIAKKLDELKAQIQEDVHITDKLNKSLKKLKTNDDGTLVIMNTSLDLHKKTAEIQQNKAQYDSLTTLEKIKLDSLADAAENNTAIKNLQKDLEQINSNNQKMMSGFNAIEGESYTEEIAG